MIFVVVAGVALSQVRDDELYVSIVENDLDRLEVAIQSGLDPETSIFVPETDKSISLLELAVRARNERAAIYLLDVGVVPSALEDGLASELVEIAAEFDMSALLDRLVFIDQYALTEVSPENHPLIIASAYGSVNSVSMLINTLNRLPPEDRVVVLQWSLSNAIRAAPAISGEIVDQLLDAGADVKGAPYLAGAAYFCRADLADIFLSAGADPTQVLDDRSSASYALTCIVQGQVDAGREILLSLSSEGVDLCDAEFILSLSDAENEALQDFMMCD